MCSPQARDSKPLFPSGVTGLPPPRLVDLPNMGSLEQTFAGDWQLTAARGQLSDARRTGYSIQRHLFTKQQPRMHVALTHEALEVTEVFKDATVMHQKIPLDGAKPVIEGFRGASFLLAGELDTAEIIITAARVNSAQMSVIRWRRDRNGNLSICVYVKHALVLVETWVRTRHTNLPFEKQTNPPFELLPALPQHLQHVPTMASKRRVWIPFVEDHPTGGAFFVLDLGLNYQGSRVALKKHYSEFVSLHWRLRRFFDEIDEFELPKRASTTLSRADILELRRARLDAFVCVIMRLTPLPGAFVQFLSVSTPKQRSRVLDNESDEDPAPTESSQFWTHCYDAVTGGAANRTKTVPTHGVGRTSQNENAMAYTVAVFLQAKSLSAQVEHTGFSGKHELYRLRLSLPGCDDDVCEEESDAPVLLKRDPSAHDVEFKERSSQRMRSALQLQTVEAASLKFKQFARIHHFLVRQCFKDGEKMLSAYFDGLLRLQASKSPWIWGTPARSDRSGIDERARNLSVYFRDVFDSHYGKLTLERKLQLFDYFQIPTTAAMRIVSTDFAYAATNIHIRSVDGGAPKFLTRNDDQSSFPSSPISSSVISRRTLALVTFELLCRKNDVDAARAISPLASGDAAHSQRRRSPVSQRYSNFQRPEAHLAASASKPNVPGVLHFDISRVAGLLNVEQLTLIFRFGDKEHISPGMQVDGDSIEWDIPERITFQLPSRPTSTSTSPSNMGCNRSTRSQRQAMEIGNIAGLDAAETRAKTHLIGMFDASGFKDKLVVLLESTNDDGRPAKVYCAVVSVSHPFDEKGKVVQLRAFNEEDIETGVTIFGSISTEPTTDFKCLLVFQERVDRSLLLCSASIPYDCTCQDDFLGDSNDPFWRHIGCVTSTDIGSLLSLSEAEIWASLTLQHSSIYGGANEMHNGLWERYDPKWAYADTIDARMWSPLPQKHSYRRQLWCQSAAYDQRMLIARAWKSSLELKICDGIRSNRRALATRQCIF